MAPAQPFNTNTKEVVDCLPGTITLYNDGSYERPTDLHVPADPGASGVKSRDVVVDKATGLWARIYLSDDVAASKNQRVPVVLFFHGGGFCVGSPAKPHTHAKSKLRAKSTGCMWVTVGYRLAPEYKLPAQYDDGQTALEWVSKAEDPWVAQYADVNRCFLVGESAGGTIVHFTVARELAAVADKDRPSRIAGMLMIHPAIVQQKPGAGDPKLSGALVHFYHISSLPENAPFGHALMNPMHPDYDDTPLRLQVIAPRLPPLLLAVAERDPLYADSLAYYEAVSAAKRRQLHVSTDRSHCFHSQLAPGSDPAADELEQVVVKFIGRRITLSGQQAIMLPAQGYYSNHVNGKEVVEYHPGVITLYSDGSFERPTDLDVSADPEASDVKSRDVMVDKAKGLWARIYVSDDVATSKNQRVPVVLFFHGGGFCVGSPAKPHTHAKSKLRAKSTGCVWVTVGYRLAPEHKLPAQYDDGQTALEWVSKAEDPWLAKYVDVDRCFLAGESAGGTIVHFTVARELAAAVDKHTPCRIAGMIMIHPAIVQQKPGAGDPNLSSGLVRFYHISSLPENAPFGHALMNPMHPDYDDTPLRLPVIAQRLPPLLLAVAEGDPLCADSLAYYDAVAAAPRRQLHLTSGRSHCFHTQIAPNSDPAADELEHVIADFIRSAS